MIALDGFFASMPPPAAALAIMASREAQALDASLDRALHDIEVDRARRNVREELPRDLEIEGVWSST